MSRAAKQCRKWVEANYPGVRISRKSCRDTAGGGVSQHSAFPSGTGAYDSNAIDIFGPEELPYDEERAFVQVIVDQLEQHREEWSIRLLLWNVADHYGHAHVDFWPTCLDHMWCGKTETSRWRKQNGIMYRSGDPDPDNGDYNGPTMEDDVMPRRLFEDMIRALFAIDEDFQGSSTYWIDLIDDPENPEWANFWTAFTRQLSKGEA